MVFAEPTHVPAPPAPDPETVYKEPDQNVVEKAYDASDHDRQLVIEEGSVAEPPSHTHGNDIAVEFEPASMTAAEDAPKKSYASIVSSQHNSFFIRKN